MGFIHFFQTEDSLYQWNYDTGWGPCSAAFLSLHFWRDANRALTPQVVLEAQLGSVSPTLLTEGVRALNWADTMILSCETGSCTGTAPYLSPPSHTPIPIPLHFCTSTYREETACLTQICTLNNKGSVSAKSRGKEKSKRSS